MQPRWQDNSPAGGKSAARESQSHALRLAEASAHCDSAVSAQSDIEPIHGGFMIVACRSFTISKDNSEPRLESA